MEDQSKIFVALFRETHYPTRYMLGAFTADADVLATATAESIERAMQDLGVGTRCCHEIYNERFGEGGWVLVPVEPGKEETHEEIRAILSMHQR